MSPQLQENEQRIRNYVGNSITKIVLNRTSYILVLFPGLICLHFLTCIRVLFEGGMTKVQHTVSRGVWGYASKH